MHGHDNDNLMVSMRCFWQSGRQTGSEKTQDWTPPAKSPARCITAIFGCWTAWSEVSSGLGRVAPVQCLALCLAPTLNAFKPFWSIYWTEGSDGSSRTACACSHNTRKSMTIMWVECDTNSTTLKTKMLWHMLQDKQFEYWIIAKGKVYTGPVAVWRDPVVQPWDIEVWEAMPWPKDGAWLHHSLPDSRKSCYVLLSCVNVSIRKIKINMFIHCVRHFRIPKNQIRMQSPKNVSHMHTGTLAEWHLH